MNKASGMIVVGQTLLPATAWVAFSKYGYPLTKKLRWCARVVLEIGEEKYVARLCFVHCKACNIEYVGTKKVLIGGGWGFDEYAESGLQAMLSFFPNYEASTRRHSICGIQDYWKMSNFNASPLHLLVSFFKYVLYIEFLVLPHPLHFLLSVKQNVRKTAYICVCYSIQ